jgi:hypothetical protein
MTRTKAATKDKTPALSPQTCALLRAVAPHGRNMCDFPVILEAARKVEAALTELESEITEDPTNYVKDAATKADARFVTWSRDEDSLQYAYTRRAELVAALEAAGLNSEDYINDLLYLGAGFGFDVGLIVASRMIGGDR